MKNNNATVSIVTITPETAGEWLENKWGEQRAVRSGHVQRLASDMIAGLFRLNSDAILRINHKLANGQHRLSAVVKSGKPQKFLVMESDDAELYKLLDCGMKRKAADALTGDFKGIIPSVARLVVAYDQRAITQSNLTNGSYLTQVQIVNFCEDNHESLVEAARVANPLYTSTKILPVSISAAIHFISERNSARRGKAESFLKAVYLGDGAEGTAANDLRNRMTLQRTSKAKLRSSYVFGLTMKAFKFWLERKRPGTLKWVENEPLPTID